MRIVYDNPAGYASQPRVSGLGRSKAMVQSVEDDINHKLSADDL